MQPPYDLVVRAGRIVCPNQKLDSPGAVAIRGNQIAACGTDSYQGKRVIDVPDAVLLPGLIDMHAHPARSCSIFGVDPDRCMLARGTTTVVSQGDAGSATCGRYVRETVTGSAVRILLAINLSSRGESGPGGCLESLAWIDVAGCIEAVDRYRDHIWAIAINASRNGCGRTDPRQVLRLGLQVACESGLPILYGMRCPEDWPIADQLAKLRPGDVVTYCFRPEPNGVVVGGQVLQAVREARDRGVLFDVGHGRASFDFQVAEAAIQQGFTPDTISTDLQRGHIGQVPAHDLPRVMSKLRAAGMVESEVFEAVTARPARILSRSEIGSLAAGSQADLALLRWSGRTEQLADTQGNGRPGGCWKPVATVRAGTVVLPDGPEPAENGP